MDSNLKETSVSKAEDHDQVSRSTQPKPLEDLATEPPADCLSGGNRSSLIGDGNSVSSATDDESLQKSSTESRDTQMETIDKIKSEVSPCSAAAAGLQNESDEVVMNDNASVERVSPNHAAEITAESKLTNEEHTNQICSKPQRDAGHGEPEANCNDGVGHGSECLHQVLIPDDSHSVHHQFEVQTPQTCSQPEQERIMEEIQNVSTLVVTAEHQSGCDGHVSESSCTEMNGGPSGDSSDEEDFLGLKRKVKGIFLRPADLFRATSNKLQSDEKLESVEQTKNESRNGNVQPETEKDDCCVKDDNIAMIMSKPVIIKGITGEDVEQDTGLANTYKHESDNCPNSSLLSFSACLQQKECSLRSNTENMDDDLKEHGTTPEDPSVASSANTPSLSSLDKSMNLPLADVGCSNALISTQSPESIGKVLTEMGPPLPPVVLPLTATPPKCRKHLTPNRPSIQLPTWPSSTEAPFSLKQQLKVPHPDPGLQGEVKSSLALTTPSPSHEVPSSPLQFGSATPKHALPVPGRLPSSALKSSSPSASQENSMQMLDTMYPELSAQARTLNILRGNVNLGRAANEKTVSPPSVNSISGNKTINSSSTAFTKTDQKAKRIGANVLLPKSAKRLRLDTCSPDPSTLTTTVQQVSDHKLANGIASPKYCPANEPSNSSQVAEGKTADNENNTQSAISRALDKLHNSCFDVLPVIRSHVFLGRISEVPVLRDEEKSVLSDFCLNQVSTFLSV